METPSPEQEPAKNPTTEDLRAHMAALAAKHKQHTDGIVAAEKDRQGAIETENRAGLAALNEQAAELNAAQRALDAFQQQALPDADL